MADTAYSSTCLSRFPVHGFPRRIEKRQNWCNAQADLIGTGKEKKRDAAKREKLHAKWLQQQDATDMEAVVAAMRSGWRRPGRNNGLDGDLVRTWQRKFIFRWFVDSTG